MLAAFGALAGTAGLGGMMKVWLDHRATKRRQTDEVALELAQRLGRRVEQLERDLQADRARCDAELRVLRHRTQNQRQLIYQLLHLFDVPAVRRKGMLASIRTDLAAIEAAEATESGLVSAAAIMESDR